jgi:hypothetical protein
MASRSSRLGPSGFKKQKYNLVFDVDEEPISDMVNEELSLTLMMSWVQKLKDKLLLKNRAMKNQKVKVKQAV